MFLNENVNTYNVSALNESYIDGSEASMYRILYESSEEWATLTEKSLKMQATAALREDTALLSEGLSEVWEKVKDFFVKLWARIKQFFKKFWAYVVGLVAMDKKWINNNKKLLEGLNVKDFTVKIYKSSLNGTPDNGIKALGELEDLAFKQSDEKDAIDKIKDKYTTDKVETFFGREREDEELSSSDFKSAVETFKTIDKTISEAKKTEGKVDNLFKAIVKYVDSVSKSNIATSPVRNNIETDREKRTDNYNSLAASRTSGGGNEKAVKNAKLAASVSGTVASAVTWALKEKRADLKKVILKGLGSRMFKDEEKAHLEESYDFGVLSQF